MRRLVHCAIPPDQCGALLGSCTVTQQGGGKTKNGGMGISPSWDGMGSRPVEVIQANFQASNICSGPNPLTQHELGLSYSSGA
ncbi:hypothetical protein F0562_012646 [Nyssa sinensis]|uniref:Uncharacterized protein n=1 Tax=Nyssa sinensis TaxID=561372 RepID=A0A5J4ZUL1_9ASTE|nr:hypothetical protein F0562_012646 [Nyssa sinensis]